MASFTFGYGGAYSYRGSLALAQILYQTQLGDFTYNTDASGNIVLTNQGSDGTSYDGLPYSGRGIELGALNDVTVGDAAKWTTYFDFATATHIKAFGVQVLNTKTINSILVSANEPSSETLSIFNANPNLVGKLALNDTIPEVDLTLIVGDEYYMCSEPSLATLYDARSAKTITITNYAATIRTNVDLQQKGIQTTAFVTDGAGVPTAYSSDLLQFTGDGRYVDTRLIPDITKPLTIKLLCTSPTSYPETRAMSGTDLDDTTNRIALGFNAGNIPQLYFGNIAISDTLKTAGSLNSLVMVWDLTTVYFYVNGAFINSAVPTIVNGSKTFLLGKLNETINAMILADPLALPKIKYSVQTATEVASEYANDKLIYPTLP